MESNLFIPKRINVGYNNRSDTYNGKLAYVIYWDAKNKLRKELSWNNWRNQEIPNDEFDNVSTEGFVLNKGVGGTRASYGWNARNEYIRVYDPRGFEFEISVANLLYILQETNSIVGKGLSGEFVYSWDGKELVLLPTSCQEYKTSVEHTKLQAKKITKADMEVGFGYKTKEGQSLVYLGRLNYTILHNKDYTYSIKPEKYHVFYNVDYTKDGDHSNGYKYYSTKPQLYYKFVGMKGFTSLAEKTTDKPVDNFAELMAAYSKSTYATTPERLEVNASNLKIKTDHPDLDVKTNEYGRPQTIYRSLGNGNFMKTKLREVWDSKRTDGSPFISTNAKYKSTFKGYETCDTHEISLKDGSFNIERKVVKVKTSYRNSKDEYYYTSPNFGNIKSAREVSQYIKPVEIKVVMDNGLKIKMNEIYHY